MTIRTKSAGGKPAQLTPSNTFSATRASLLFGTALGCSIAIMAAAPDQAWAGDECGADIAGVAICTAISGVGNPYPAGIDYVADPGEDITVSLTGGGVLTAVTVVTATDDGVSAIGVAGFDATVITYAGASIAAFNDGIDVDTSAGGAATVVSYADITSGAQGIEAVALGAGGDVTVLNYGDILINGDTNAGYAFATGIYAQADDGLLISNSGLIDASSTTDFSVFGIEATSVAGYATVFNTNDIDVSNTFFYAYGISVTGADGLLVSQTGNIDVHGEDETYGIRTISQGGSANVVLTGDVSVESLNSEAIGVSAVSLGGVASINVTGDIYSDVDNYAEANTGVYALSFGGVGLGLVDIDVVGDITISDGADATGIDVLATGGVDVDVTGDIRVGDFAGTADTGLATGIDVRSYFSGTDVTVVGDVDVYGTRNASGVEVIASANATVNVTGAIYAYSTDYNGLGILAWSTAVGDASVTLVGNLDIFGDDYADGILAFSSTGDASVTVTGDVSADAYRYGAHGLYLYAGEAASVDMTGDIDVQSYATAYGILVRAGSIEIDMVGDIDAAADNGVVWGVYASASGAVDIAMTGDIYTDVDNAFLNNTGILATSTSSTVDLLLAGDITISDGAFATGIDVTALGTVTLDATGAIQVGDYAGSFYTFFAYGIDARSTGADVATDVTGTVHAYGYIGAVGIRLDSDLGDVAMTGTVDVVVDGALGSATGVDLDAGQEAYANITGDIDANASGDAIGVLANGDSVNVTIDGDITAAGDGAWGVLASSGPGGVYVNVGDVSVYSDFAGGYGQTSGAGIQADTYFDVTIIAGAIVTHGDSVEGVDVQAESGFVDPAAGAVTVSVGSITTYGDFAEGMFIDATDDVGVSVSGSVRTHGDIATGIFAHTDGGYIEIDAVDIATLGAFAPGVTAQAQTGVNVVVTGDITTEGTSSWGVNATTTNGDAFVSVVDITTLGNFSDGVQSNSINGDAYATASGRIYTEGYLSRGVSVFSAYGDATLISSAYVHTDGGRSDGLWAYAANGYAYVLNTGTVITEGPYADALFAGAHNGDATAVNSGEAITRGDNANAVFAFAYSGDASATNTAAAGASGEGSFGVAALSYDGDATVTNTANVSTSGDGGHGLYAHADNGVATVDNLDGHVETSGDFAYGIFADGDAGANVANGDNTVITSGFSAVGIFAFSAADYVRVNSGTVNTSGDFSDGIVATSLGGAAADYVTVNSDLIITTGDFADGIDAFALSGDVSILSLNVFTHGANATGIAAEASSGDVSILIGNVITYGAGSDAIVASTGGLNGATSDDVYVYVFGQVFSFGGSGMVLDSAGYAEVDLAAGQIHGDDVAIRSASVLGTRIYNEGYISADSGYAIDTDGGSTFIVNEGTIYGFVNLTDSNDTFYNNGLWETYATSAFGGATDLIGNNGVVGFSRYNGAAATTTFTGLEFFDNYGLISGRDQQVNDVLAMPGAAFFGGPGSEFEFDVQLAGPGSLADRLVIGSAGGSTLLTPNDVLAGQPGVLNLSGILVVDSANPAEVGNEFYMANIEKGFVEYFLYFDGANDNWLIIGLPDDEVFELLGAMAAGQEFWRRSGDAVSTRWQEQRDAGADGGVSRSDGWELWMQAHAGDEGFERVESFDIGGFAITQDMTYRSDWRGFQFGFDNLSGDTIWGLTMGFNQQENRFDLDGNSFDTEGWNAGAYAGWASGGFFLNGLVKGSFYEVDGNFHTLPSLFTFDGTTWGVKGEVGYRWQGEQLFLEPVVTLAWTTTDLDSFTTSGATVAFDAADSLRGKAGARIGGTFGSGSVVLTPYVGAYWVEEFEGDNSLAFTSGPTTIAFGNAAPGDHGQLDFGLTAQTFYGLEGFLKGEWNFGGDADGGTARIGVRWRW